MCVRCSCSAALDSVPTDTTVVGVTVPWFYGCKQNEGRLGEKLHAVSLAQRSLVDKYVAKYSINSRKAQDIQASIFPAQTHKERCDIICLDPNIWNCQVFTDTQDDIKMVLLPQNNHPVLCWSHLYWHCLALVFFYNCYYPLLPVSGHLVSPPQITEFLSFGLHSFPLHASMANKCVLILTLPLEVITCLFFHSAFQALCLLRDQQSSNSNFITTNAP